MKQSEFVYRIIHVLHHLGEPVMAIDTRSTTDAEIFTEVLTAGASSVNPELARWLLTLRFTPRQQARMQQLAESGNERELTPQEHSEVERFRRIGTMLSTLHSQARLTLQSTARSA
jgi:hypothetical protein